MLHFSGWGILDIPCSVYGRSGGFSLHLAFEMLLDDLLHATKMIKPLSFFDVETTEPSVICWMLATSVYFRDPDGNMLEYISMIEKEPRPELGIIPSGLIRLTAIEM